MSSASNNPGNFANRPKEEVQAIASKGGQASGNPEHKYNTRSNPTESTGGGTHSEAAAKNPHNFANMPKEEVQHLGHLGGVARAEQTHGGQTHGAGKTGQAEQAQDVDLSLPGKEANFHNRPKEEVREIAHKGGVASGEKRREQAAAEE